MGVYPIRVRDHRTKNAIKSGTNVRNSPCYGTGASPWNFRSGDMLGLVDG